MKTSVHAYSNMRKQQGLITVLVTISMLVILGFAALAVDINQMVLSKAKLQNAVDSAALSAAKFAESSTEQGDIEQVAIDTLEKYGQASGNASLSFPDSTNDSLIIELSNTAESASDFPDSDVDLSDDTFVRVELNSYSLPRYFLGLFGLEMEVTVSAVAGPSSGSGEVCDVFPIGVCTISSTDDSSDSELYGYVEGTTYSVALTSATQMVAGNFQFLDVGNGASDLKYTLADSSSNCYSADDSITTDTVTVTTETGENMGAMIGLNTRFGVYSGSLKNSRDDYPPDVYTTEMSTEASTEESTEISTEISTEVSTDDSLYSTYVSKTSDCLEDDSGDGCESDGEEGRRVIIIPILDCSTATSSGGKTDYDVVTYGCFFLPEQAPTTGNSGSIYAEFIEQCDSSYSNSATSNGVAGETSGEYRTVLYKDPKSTES